MVIYIGADHRGFELKEHIKKFLKPKGYQMVDLGAERYEKGDDYPDFAQAVARRVSSDYENARGILICGSGVGVDIVANKFMKVRSALIVSANQAFDSRNDDDSNILCLGANYLNPDDVKQIVTVWLETPFAGEERFRRRLNKISQLEMNILKPVADDENPLVWK